MDMVEIIRQCEICSANYTVRSGGFSRRYCYECSPINIPRSEIASYIRSAIKRQLISEFGGKCKQCGYNKSVAALVFHHINPAEKDFNLSSNGKILSMSQYRAEASKCELLCFNCHTDIHAPERPILQTNEEAHILLGAKRTEESKKCIICSSAFYMSKRGHARKYCYECAPYGIKRSAAINYIINAINRQIISENGGRCTICNFDKNRNVLRFHHAGEDAKKERVKAGTLIKDISLCRLKAEKCILLCTNCYAETHEHVRVVSCTNAEAESQIQKYTSKQRQCETCGSNIERKNKTGLCRKCLNHLLRAERPSKETLLKQLKTQTFVAVGKKYGVADNTIRKWIRQYET